LGARSPGLQELERGADWLPSAIHGVAGELCQFIETEKRVLLPSVLPHRGFVKPAQARQDPSCDAQLKRIARAAACVSPPQAAQGSARAEIELL
jgi:hypothetical protein